MLRRIPAVLFLATSLAACVADGESTDGTDGAGGKADGVTPVLRFDADWSETASGTLLAGDRMRVDYDLARLTECRGSTNGSEVWGVSGYASFNGGAPVTFGLSRLESGRVKPVIASVDIPATATSVELWFSVNNRWGCIAYDSNENANYTFAIKRNASGAVIAFEADWTESQSDAIHAGDRVVVHYDPERLAQCASSSGGHPTWGVTGYWRVDGGATKTLTVARANGSSLEPADATLTVPRGSDLELWFDASSTYGCHAYDSNLGANYHFSIEQ